MSGVSAQARLEAARKRIEEAKARTRDLRPTLETIAQEISDRIHAGFEAGTEPGGAPWEKLADSTIRQKTRKKRSLTPLTATGTMRGSTAVEVAGPHTIAMGVGAAKAQRYAGFHQFGSDGGKIKQRRFLPIMGAKGGPYKFDGSGHMARAKSMIEEKIVEFIIGKSGRTR